MNIVEASVKGHVSVRSTRTVQHHVLHFFRVAAIKYGVADTIAKRGINKFALQNPKLHKTEFVKSGRKHNREPSMRRPIPHQKTSHSVPADKSHRPSATPPSPTTYFGGAESQVPVAGRRCPNRSELDPGDQSCGAWGTDDDHNSGPPPWSAEDRRRALAPVTDFLGPLSAAEMARWSLVTIVAPKLWFERGAVIAADFKNARRQLLRQIKNTGLTIGIFVLDTVVRHRFGETDGPVGLQFHFHGPIRISFPDKRGKKAFREALGRWARGNRAVKFDQIKDDKGGAHGFAHYGLKDLRNPLKTFGRRIVPTNDGWTRDMRRIVADSGLRPDHLIVLHGIKRYGRTVRVLDPDVRREIAGAKFPPAHLVQGHRRFPYPILPNGCLAPIAAPSRVPPLLRQIPFNVIDTDWTPVLSRISMPIQGRPAPRLRPQGSSLELIGRGHVHRHLPPAIVYQLAGAGRDQPKKPARDKYHRGKLESLAGAEEQ